jgi:uncharacterized protein involved in exopolysaccharide biosynthesis
MIENPNPPQTTTNSDEIDLIEVIRHIWNGRWLIAKVTGAFIVLGLIIAFTSTEQFKAEARLLPEIKDTRGGASALLRQFGGLGGLNIPMGEGADAIRPDLYPDVLKATPFYTELMQQQVVASTKSGKHEVSVFEYVDQHISSSFWGGVKKYTIRLPWTLKEILTRKEPIEKDSAIPGQITQMSQAQFEAIKKLKDRISTGIDQRSGVISISAEFPDRTVAAQVAQFAVDYLTGYITEYRILKAQKDLEFTQDRAAEKEKEFHQAQESLARFRDANRNIISAAVQTEEQRLQDQYNLAFNVYNGLAQQLEQARIKVQEETPVITLLEPVSVPVERSKPKRGMVMVVTAFLGVIVGLGWLFGTVLWGGIARRLKEPEK